VPIPGFDTPATNNLRLWSSKAASGEFDFQKFNSGDYESSVGDQQRAETISAVLYPNDNLDRGKELRLKQQYFWVAASLYDIVRRFKKSRRAWSEFPEQIAIQLNDTHPTLAIVELQRILLDLEGLEWDEAWTIVSKTVSAIGRLLLHFKLLTSFSSATPTTLYFPKPWRNGLYRCSRTYYPDTCK
jgi:starch phosphorylase